ncbi:D-xylose transport system substrate-binding protein [Jiangella alkaliphila]|uniref:D-xylose transport system substrate-binding protein n=1 Tax=Jiangella alkaliphila TaxID=419479 RepID=A0A1H2JR36_9ACTN|nr:D-xylose transport system substrate-binding protein [Jiangella alkaliphila]
MYLSLDDNAQAFDTLPSRPIYRRAKNPKEGFTVHQPNRRAAVFAVLALAAGALAACGANEDDNDNGGGSDETASGGASIALLLPEAATARYEAFDRPLFEAKVAELCADCEVVYFNADQDEAQQAEQVDSAISQNVDVMVLDPVNGVAAASLVADAQAADIPVIAYDRFIEGADYYTSFDNERVGELQGQALVDAVGAAGDILMLNGSPDDPNAAQFKSGAHSIIDASDLTVVGEYDNPDWSPDNAQSWTTDQLNTIDPASLAGVYAANDGQAGGVIAALTGAGIAADALPPVTGQDAELAAIQRIVAGEQYMTVYKPIPVEAEGAAEAAISIVNGEEVADTVDFQGVPSLIHDPIVVTADNVADTVVADEFWSVDEICTADYADACAAAGLS